MSGATLTGAVIVRGDGPSRASLSVSDDTIVSVSPSDAPTIDLSGHLILPGLINAHDHLDQNAVPALRSVRPVANSYEWAAAFGSHFQRPEVASAMAVPRETRCWHGALKNLLAGTTTVAHHDPWIGVLDAADFPVRLLRRFGWCHSLRKAPREGLVGKLLNRAAPLLGWPHPYGPSLAASFRSTPADAPWIIHLAEGTDAITKGELDRLDRLGALAANTVAVHGVGFSPDDVERIILRGAAVVWCPSSNLSLLDTTLSPGRLFEAGRLALGTDARVSGSRDLLEELRVAAAHSRLAPRDLLRLVTADAARVLAMPEVGGVAPGQRADLAILRDDGRDPATQVLALARADLRAIVRDGKPALGDPDLAGWFATAGVETVSVMLDGRPKLLARRFARADALALEPGLVSVSS